MAPPLTTERLRLRPITDEDAPAIMNVLGDFGVARNIKFAPHPYSLQDAHAFIAYQREQSEAGHEHGWVIDQTGVFAGFIGLGKVPGDDESEFGYFLAQDHWGKGFATEAGRAVISHAFEAMETARISAGHAKDNLASARVLAKLGFKVTGESEAFYNARKATVPRVHLELARADWIRLTT